MYGKNRTDFFYSVDTHFWERVCSLKKFLIEMFVYNNSLWKTRQTQKTKQNSGPDQMRDNASHQYEKIKLAVRRCAETCRSTAVLCNRARSQNIVPPFQYYFAVYSTWNRVLSFSQFIQLIKMRKQSIFFHEEVHFRFRNLLVFRISGLLLTPL